MKTQKIGTTELLTSRLAHGGMRLTTVEDGANVCVAAYEAGYKLFDTADVYDRGRCESILGQALRQVRGFRDSVLIATKCAVRRRSKPTPDAPYWCHFSEDHILMSCGQM